MSLLGADKTTKVRITYLPVTIKHNMFVCELFGNAMLVEPSHWYVSSTRATVKDS